MASALCGKFFMHLVQAAILGRDFVICGYPCLSSNWKLTMFCAKIGLPSNMILRVTFITAGIRVELLICCQDPVQT